MADGIGRAAALIEAVLRRTGLNSRHINFPESEMLQDFQQGTRMAARGTTTTAVRSSPFESSSDRFLQPVRIALRRQYYQHFLYLSCEPTYRFRSLYAYCGLETATPLVGYFSQSLE